MRLVIRLPSSAPETALQACLHSGRGGDLLGERERGRGREGGRECVDKHCCTVVGCICILSKLTYSTQMWTEMGPWWRVYIWCPQQWVLAKGKSGILGVLKGVLV